MPNTEIQALILQEIRNGHKPLYRGNYYRVGVILVTPKTLHSLVSSGDVDVLDVTRRLRRVPQLFLETAQVTHTYINFSRVSTIMYMKDATASAGIRVAKHIIDMYCTKSCKVQLKLN